MIRSNASDPVKFCHISPTKFLSNFTTTNGAHLLLAHLVEEDPAYADYYANLDDSKVKILDNSAFEMYKRGEPMYDSSKLITMAKRCKADIIVLSDYPKQPWTKTKLAAENLIPQFKDSGFGTFYVPQGELSDLTGVLRSFEWGLQNKEIDLIGVSILTCPTAFGIEDTKYNEKDPNKAFKLQRFLSRWKMFRELDRAGFLDTKAIKRFHCLGMTEGPNEIQLLEPYHRYIYSWDSSAAVWAGINGVQFDHSPSGLTYGKIDSEVDFSYSHEIPTHTKIIHSNIQYINNLCLM